MRKDKITLWVFVIVLIISIPYIWHTFAKHKEPVKIGFLATLSGGTSDIGVAGRNAALLAVDDINKAGGIKGRKVELITQNDKYNLEDAFKAAQSLIAKDVTTIIGPMTSNVGNFLVLRLKNDKILFVSPTVASDSLTGIDDNFIRVIPKTGFQGSTLAQKAIKVAKSKRAAILFDLSNKGFTDQVAAEFRKVFEQRGGTVVYEKGFAVKDNSDFKKFADNILLSKPDVVISLTNALHNGLISQYLKRKKPDLQLFFPAWSMTDELIKQGGRAVEGAYIVGFSDSLSKKPGYVQFRKKYINRFGSEPLFSSLLAYEAVTMLAEALNKTDDFEISSIKSAILKKKYYKGLQEDFAIDKNGDVIRDYILFQVKNDKFVRVN